MTTSGQPLWRTAPHPTVQPSALFKPLIGVTADVIVPPDRPSSPRAACALTYVHALRKAGAVPVILSPDVDLVGDYLRQLDGFLLTGGDDPRTEPFGEPTHASATPVDPRRQEFETRLLELLNDRPRTPALGICLGMQMMALVAGGKLNQHMPDDVPTHEDHRHDRLHAVLTPTGSSGPVNPMLGLIPSLACGGTVTSHHRQAVREPGRMAVLAQAPDGIIEAVNDPARPFYLGVQWHPERTTEPGLGLDIIRALVRAASAEHARRTSAG